MWRLLLSGVCLTAFALVLDRRILGARAAQTNYTMDDMNMTIIYSPSTWWFSSTNVSGCTYCLAPQDHDVAFNSTWHHGLHIIPTIDGDDSNPSSSLVPPTSTSASTSPSRTPSSGDVDNDQTSGNGDSDDNRDADTDADDQGSDTDSDSDDDRDSDDDDDSDHDHDADDKSGDKDDSHKGRSRRSILRAFVASTTGVAAALETGNPFTTAKFDSDDPQFVDQPVFVLFNFSGTGIYVNCLLPLSVPANANMTPTFTNLTFTLDGQPAGNFLHDGSPQDNGFQPNATVFSQADLSDGQHTFRMDLGPNSVFLLDSITVTQDDATASANSTNSDPASSSNKSSSSGSNTATFVGAIGGSVGVLAVIALCVAGSIIRRRRRSARRERRERERAYWNSDNASFHTFDDEASVAGSGSGPSMRAVAPPGPLTFVPRYFPGVVPPPTYRLAPGVDTSYAEVLPDDEAEEEDETPATVPEPIDETDEIPPPFAVAIASPEPPLLATAMRRDHSPISPNPEMSEAGFTVPLLSHTGIVSPRPPLSRPPSFRSTVSGSAVPSSISPSETQPSGPTTSVTDVTSVRSSAHGDSRSVRSVRSVHVASSEGGVGSGEEAVEGAGEDGPTEGSGPSVDAQGAPERIRDGEDGEATIETTPGAVEGSPPVDEGNR